MAIPTEYGSLNFGDPPPDVDSRIPPSPVPFAVTINSVGKYYSVFLGDQIEISFCPYQ